METGNKQYICSRCNKGAIEIFTTTNPNKIPCPTCNHIGGWNFIKIIKPKVTDALLMLSIQEAIDNLAEGAKTIERLMLENDNLILENKLKEKIIFHLVERNLTIQKLIS